MKKLRHSMFLGVLICLTVCFAAIGLQKATKNEKSSSPTPPKDMVLIPAGEFIMGSGEVVDEMPQRKVYLDAFFIDKYEVTNAQYKKFLDATSRKLPMEKEDWGAVYSWQNGTYPAGKENDPVVLVSWEDAAAYAKWAGKRLPTEAEWEKAARGEDGRKWPWGKFWKKEYTNTLESEIFDTMPVDSFPEGKSPSGVFNMAGNVWEWVQDWHARYPPQTPDDTAGKIFLRNPKGPEKGTFHIARGGDWASDRKAARCSNRGVFNPHFREQFYIGFRCAKDVK